jgi:hypothetical protein
VILSRKDSDLLSYLEIVILELHPQLFSDVDETAFLKGKLDGTFQNIVSGRLADISGGPQSSTKIDEIHDFQDRARASLSSQMSEAEPNFSNPTEEDAEKIQKVMRAGAYFEAWRTWGRAITSLDFVELSVRKPSFVKLLKHWAQLAAVISIAGNRFVRELSKKADEDGKPFSEKLKQQGSYIAQVNMPLASAQGIFSHIGSSSVHQLLLEAFEELDLQSPEALGAACMLIRQRPDGWAKEIKRYIDQRDPSGTKGIVQYFLLEALYQEYYFRHLTSAEQNAIEGVTAHLLSHAGFVGGKKEAILQSIEKGRSRVDLLTRAIKQ